MKPFESSNLFYCTIKVCDEIKQHVTRYDIGAAFLVCWQIPWAFVTDLLIAPFKIFRKNK